MACTFEEGGPNKPPAYRIKNVMRATFSIFSIVSLSGLLAGCADKSEPTASQKPTVVAPVYVVLFTHIEDQTPGGVLGTAANRTSFQSTRSALVQMAQLAKQYQMKWSLQPDWKILLAALEYNDGFLTLLRDTLGVAIDPHSHEGGGYNYTDVAHLLDSLHVGGSTVIGGHVWDPALAQFQKWDRYRVPVAGLRYPSAIWRGDILMGSGTPNHTNDPVISGVWRPLSRDRYFVDDPNGNVVAVGAFRDDLTGVSELSTRYRSGVTVPSCMLTATIHISPSTITSAGGLATIENTVLKPLVALRDSGFVKITDFTSLVATWRSQFGATACVYQIT